MYKLNNMHYEHDNLKLQKVQRSMYILSLLMNLLLVTIIIKFILHRVTGEYISYGSDILSKVVKHSLLFNIFDILNLHI